jgi:hypothetical protein
MLSTYLFFTWIDFCDAPFPFASPELLYFDF